MAKQKKPGLPQFPLLANFCQSLCVLPHGNADCERVFSMVRHMYKDRILQSAGE